MAKKLQQLVKDALASVYPALDAMTDAQLRNVRAATVKLNGTNCWCRSLVPLDISPKGTVPRTMPAVTKTADAIAPATSGGPAVTPSRAGWRIMSSPASKRWLDLDGWDR